MVKKIISTIIINTLVFFLFSCSNQNISSIEPTTVDTDIYFFVPKGSDMVLSLKDEVTPDEISDEASALKYAEKILEKGLKRKKSEFIDSLVWLDKDKWSVAFRKHGFGGDVCVMFKHPNGEIIRVWETTDDLPDE